MGLTQSLSTSAQHYLNHPLLGPVAIDNSLQNYYRCASIEVSYQLPDQTAVDCWLNWLKCNFDGLNIDENDGFMHLMFGKEEEYQQEHFKSLLLPIKYQWKQRGMFGKGGVLKIHFEAFTLSLEQEIEQRAKSGRPFKQTELWLLLYKLIELQQHFEKREKNIGNIHPRNILINSRLQFKVFGKHSSINGMDSFEATFQWLKGKPQHFEAKAFLAPEEIQGINSCHQLKIDKNVSISQVFSIGMTVLCAAMLVVGDSFYRIDRQSNLLEVRLDEVQNALKYLRQTYSSFLYHLMRKILDPDPHQRISASYVYSSLKEYEPDILNLREFLPENKQIKPKKMQSTSLPRTLSEFELRLEEHKMENEFRKSQEEKLREFYRKWKY